jgi:hypothetical protein
MGLIRQSDKRVISDPNTRIPHHLEHWLDELKEYSDLSVVYYAAPVSIVRDRLNLLGYTLATSREAFEEYVSGERQQYDNWSKRPSDGDNLQLSETMSEHWKATHSLLCSLTVDSWLAGLEEIRRSGLRPNYYGRYEGPHEGTLIGYLLSNEWYGFPGPDRNVALRLALEVCPDAQELIYDVTELVWSGYFSADEDLVEYSLNLFAEEHQSTAKIILLTEGKSDSAILRESLELLFPHLAKYYSFMEFDAARVGGGAGNLVNLVKAFAGAGIANRTIALFDNDTAAAAALKTLERVALPPHIKTLRLPDLTSLKSYPTIGPSGTVSMDVNGVAGSIELYLGEDVLNDGAELVPIQWKGFDAGMRRYQGEVLEKDKLHERFFRKVECAKSDQSSLAGPQWVSLRAIFADVFAAFHDFDRGHILDSARSYHDC